MAKNLIILCILLLHFSALTVASEESDEFFSKKISSLQSFKNEKLTHLHFYFHDIVTAKNPTAVRVAEATMTNASSTFFGAVSMMDDPLTVAPELSSKMVGRAQGIYAEMPIVGGSGVFRFARGYAQAKTYSWNPKTGNAVVEYNVYVLHY
ncbi:hypothetical protein EZV62_025669 [Acer yangbiense]|uniref:Dirigent protein n=1 Tax=Acer yangbiense TaxID=1000413 RepID=A0A5C7GYG7_9ROSI|nr:hypothetical protein EZV62_025669 [Acer yangbiense]